MNPTTSHNAAAHRATIETLKAKHAAQLEQANTELAFWEGLQDMPNLTPWLFYGSLYAVQHVSCTLPETGHGYKQFDPAAVPALLDWIEANALPIHKWHKGPRQYVYNGPAVPQTPNYSGSISENEGKPPAKFAINYSTIMRRAVLDFYITHETSGQLVRVSVELPNVPQACRPIAIPSQRLERIDGYRKAHARTPEGREAVTAQTLRHSVDQQNADTTTLYTAEQIREALNIKPNQEQQP